MSTRLPTPGSDTNQWGDILNNYLLVSHTPSGSLKPNSVGATQLQNNIISIDNFTPELQQQILNATGSQGEKGDKGEQGEKGDKGDPGERGEQGPQGTPGAQGQPGQDGSDGQDGREVQLRLNPTPNPTHIQWRYNSSSTTPASAWTDLISLDDITGPQGEPGIQGEKGEQGEPGEKGEPGEQGSPGTQGERGEPGPQGEPGTPGEQGEQGPQGERGEQGIQGPPGPGLPTGGNTGQILAKNSSSDHDTAWINPPEGGGGTNTNISSTTSPTQVSITSSTGTGTTIASATTTNAGVMSAADKTKLDSLENLDPDDFATAAQGSLAQTAVQPAAIANFETTTQLNTRDTTNRNRSNHTGTQSISTISGLQGELDGKVGVLDIKSEIYYDNSSQSWPARTVPSGYTGWVIWDSAPYEDAPAPPAALEGDRWRRFYTS